MIVVMVACIGWAAACDSGSGGSTDGENTSSTDVETPESGDIDGTVGAEIQVGEAIVMVRALQEAFQPAVPEQRLSVHAPTSPSSGESFYQAYVRVQNNGVSPIRVDPEDFACAVGNAVVSVEPTRSGPLPRSLLKNTSLDLLLTFKAEAGFEPILLYSPPWYDGVIRVSPQSQETTTTATS